MATDSIVALSDVDWKKAADTFKTYPVTYSGPFTEALLVGNLATRLQRRIEWDGASMRATNAPEAEGLIRKAYRKGFEI